MRLPNEFTREELLRIVKTVLGYEIDEDTYARSVVTRSRLHKGVATVVDVRVVSPETCETYHVQIDEDGDIEIWIFECWEPAFPVFPRNLIKYVEYVKSLMNVEGK